MSVPGFIEREMEIFPEVETSLISYMRRKGCSFNVALSHALKVLGGVDVAKQAGEEVVHVPGYTAQSEVEAFQTIYGQEIHLEKVGQSINSKPRKIPVQVDEKAYNSLRAYTQGRAVAEAAAIMHATFLLILCLHGDLWVRPFGKKPLRVILEK
ncbi:MAG TPA: hypothetical protein VFH06_02920 [Candidatus Saccharimonadales bacterium]|nr:hypothetical protein [Candidatus Saccharimonadales bacterium]